MKKFLFVVAACLTLVFVPVVAQEVINPENPTDAGWGFESFTALTALTSLVIPFVVEIMKRAIPKMPSLVIQIVSWVIGVAVAFVGFALNIGFLAGLQWYIVAAYGLGAGLIANGVFETGIVTYILGLFGIKDTKAQV